MRAGLWAAVTAMGTPPSRIRSGLAPGGLWAAVVVDGVMVDGVALDPDHLARVGDIAEDHAATASATGGGVGIYDGDTGDLVAVLVLLEGGGE